MTPREQGAGFLSVRVNSTAPQPSIRERGTCSASAQGRWVLRRRIITRAKTERETGRLGLAVKLIPRGNHNRRRLDDDDEEGRRVDDRAVADRTAAEESGAQGAACCRYGAALEGSDDCVGAGDPVVGRRRYRLRVSALTCPTPPARPARPANLGRAAAPDRRAPTS